MLVSRPFRLCYSAAPFVHPEQRHAAHLAGGDRVLQCCQQPRSCRQEPSIITLINNRPIPSARQIDGGPCRSGGSDKGTGYLVVEPVECSCFASLRFERAHHR